MANRKKIMRSWPENLDVKEEMEILFDDKEKNLKDRDEGPVVIEYAALVSTVDRETGDDKELVMIKEEAGPLWASISATFVDDFITIMDWADGGGATIKELRLERDVSKRGREFLRCRISKFEREGVEHNA